MQGNDGLFWMPRYSANAGVFHFQSGNYTDNRYNSKLNKKKIMLVSEHFKKASFLYFSNSKLYSHFSNMIANDIDLLKLISHCRIDRSFSYLFFGVVQNLILEGISHPISEIYKNVTAQKLDNPNPFPIFKDFCDKYWNKIKAEIIYKRVQTNEIGRSIYYFLALQQLSKILNNTEIGLIDIGCSMGVNLVFDQHEYNLLCEGRSVLRFGNGINYDVQNKFAMKLNCEIIGNKLPNIKFSALNVEDKLGIEINPLSPSSKNDTRWLSSLVWPEQSKRRDRLIHTIKQLGNCNIDILKGDVLHDLHEVCINLPKSKAICIFHSHLFEQFDHKSHDLLANQISKVSKCRQVAEISLERDSYLVALKINLWKQGCQRFSKVIALCCPHGSWIKWLGM